MQTEDPLLQRVDKVTCGLGQDGAENVFAVYAPFADKAPGEREAGPGFKVRVRSWRGNPGY